MKSKKLMQVYMKYKKLWHVCWHVSWFILEVISVAIMAFTHSLYMYCCGALLLLISIAFIIHYAYFNEKERFDKDSIYICFSYFIPILFLISLAFIGLNIKDSWEYLKDFTLFSFILIFILWNYFLIIYFCRCKKVINEIRKDKHLFIGKMVGSTLATFLVFAVATIFVISFPGDNIVKGKSVLGIQNYLSLIYQLLNVFINSIIIFIDMFSYVRSEIDEFNKEEKEKQEQIESIIKEKRKILKKEKQEQEKDKYKYDFYNYD